MIDEYVKKHYGDLERGVLAPEVKYKVLTKILKKKLKEKKSEVKVLRRFLKHKDEFEGWVPSPDKVLLKEDGFNQVAGAVKNCTLCKHSRMLSALNYEGAYTSCLWCDKKNEKRSALDEVCDKFVPKSGSCYEFEDKESSYLDWLHDDITWCCRECSNMNCERNSRNRRCKEGLYSVADMFDPFKCPVDAEMPKQP